MKISITEMHVMVNMKLKAFFAVVLDDCIRMYGFKLFQNNDGEYSIEPPFERFINKKTGKEDTARHIHLNNDIKKAVMVQAIIDFKKKNRELISQVVASKASKEV
ncbi:MAG: hypothetical protein A2Y12_19125 [Planctomycetes bacterium GWF2_42_9]|nr:MAG: hypothetical protein A2Y12_19125 [Planctomycetes bacterium GWF2_42_9]